MGFLFAFRLSKCHSSGLYRKGMMENYPANARAQRLHLPWFQVVAVGLAGLFGILREVD